MDSIMLNSGFITPSKEFEVVYIIDGKYECEVGEVMEDYIYILLLHISRLTCFFLYLYLFEYLAPSVQTCLEMFP